MRTWWASLGILCALAVCMQPILADEAAQEPDVGYASFVRPLWALGFEDARWLLPEKTPSATLIVLTGFSDATKREVNQPEVHRTTVMGAWARAIPFYLGESIWHHTSAEATVLLPVAKGIGPALFAQPYDDDEIKVIFDNDLDEKKPDFVITGVEAIDLGGFRTRIELTIWGLRHQQVQVLRRMGIVSWTKGPGELAQEIEGRVLSTLSDLGVQESPQAPSHYLAPDKQIVPYYIHALEQLLLQSLAANDMFSADQLYDEESKFRDYLQVCELLPSAIQPRLMFVRGLMASEKYGSTSHKPFESLGLNWLERPADGDDVLWRLSPIVLKKLGRTQEFERRRQELLGEASGEYRAWLEKL